LRKPILHHRRLLFKAERFGAVENKMTGQKLPCASSESEGKLLNGNKKYISLNETLGSVSFIDWNKDIIFREESQTS